MYMHIYAPHPPPSLELRKASKYKCDICRSKSKPLKSEVRKSQVRGWSYTATSRLAAPRRAAPRRAT